jgi:hypothetical protein
LLEKKKSTISNAVFNAPSAFLSSNEEVIVSAAERIKSILFVVFALLALLSLPVLILDFHHQTVKVHFYVL